MQEQPCDCQLSELVSEPVLHDVELASVLALHDAELALGLVFHDAELALELELHDDEPALDLNDTLQVLELEHTNDVDMVLNQSLPLQVHLFLLRCTSCYHL